MTQNKAEKKPKQAAAADEAIQQPEPPKTDRPTVAQAKKACCDKLTKIFTSKLMNERLMKMAGGDASRVAKNLTSFLGVITQDEGGSYGNKKYYMECTLPSLTMCFLESMNMQLPFDSRNLISMIIYEDSGGLKAELDISYKGLINAVSKHYDNAFIDAKVVWDDELEGFEWKESPALVEFTHTMKNPFRIVDKDMTGVAGAYCYMSWTTKDGRFISRGVRMSKEEVLRVRDKAKTKNVWNEWTGEQILKTVLRRGSKIPFAAIDLDVDVEEVGNRHYELDKPSGLTRLESLLKAQEEVVNGAMGNDEKFKGEDEKKVAANGDKVAEGEDDKQALQSSQNDSNESASPPKEFSPKQEGKETLSDKVAIPETKITEAQYEELKK